MFAIYRILQSHSFPEFLDDNYGDSLQDIQKLVGFTMLSSGYFQWLINIRPGHLVYCQGMTYYMESYLPSQFARQFNYSQLYVGNPNQKLEFQGNLFEGAQAWHHFCIGNTCTQFILPHKMPNLSISLGFCTWYHTANAITGFCMNHDCIKEIEGYYFRKKSDERSRFSGMDEFLNLKDDDETEDEGGATKVRDEATAREGEGTEVVAAEQGAEAMAAEQGAEPQGEEVPVSGITWGVTYKRPRASEAGL